MACPIQIRTCGPYANHADVMRAFENTCIQGGTITGAAISGGTISGAAISGGTINNTPIGATTPAAGTFTVVNITRTSAQAELIISANAGQTRWTVLRTGALNRWVIGVSNTAEGGSNLGSDFFINRYDDTGVTPTSALTIARNSGFVAFGAGIGIAGNLVHTGANIGLHGNAAVPRPTYGAPTGTATRTTFATGSVTLPQLAERVKAMIDDLRLRGDFA